ncbi:MAG: response regulator [Chloroflexota bacterium]|nr:response regulator [Chloroflexota bacterium]
MAARMIMVVDDDTHIRSALKYRLEKEGYCVLLSGDGLDAVEKVKVERPDLIILDLAMPRLNGFGFLERLRSEAETKAIPVIVLTAYDSEENRTRSFELGAVEFVPKPFGLRELIADVGRALNS